ncbi:hypothetical protein CBS101457_000019 [Exobasidium rhododendri]|nr:hypothetical protein CBS101457_000019 [Exobasidium rhododendri]
MSAIRMSLLGGAEIIEAPSEYNPQDDEVCIRNVYVASNPKDWKLSVWGIFEGIDGSDTAGFVSAVGKGVTEVRVGDRVIACTPSATSDRHGTYQPFSIAPKHLVARIPDTLPFAEAATLPLCFVTAVVAIHGVLRVPEVRSDRYQHQKILINGAGSSIGFYAAQLARLAGLEVHAIVQSEFSRKKLLAVGFDNVIMVGDNDTTLSENSTYTLAFDAISTPFTVAKVAALLSPTLPSLFSILAGGSVEDVLAVAQEAAPLLTEVLMTNSGATSQLPDSLYASLVQRWLGKVGDLILQGDFTPQPHLLLPDGIRSVPRGLKMLREGETGGRKLIYHIGGDSAKEAAWSLGS